MPPPTSPLCLVQHIAFETIRTWNGMRGRWYSEWREQNVKNDINPRLSPEVNNSCTPRNCRRIWSIHGGPLMSLHGVMGSHRQATYSDQDVIVTSSSKTLLRLSTAWRKLSNWRSKVGHVLSFERFCATIQTQLRKRCINSYVKDGQIFTTC